MKITAIKSILADGGARIFVKVETDQPELIVVPDCQRREPS